MIKLSVKFSGGSGKSERFSVGDFSLGFTSQQMRAAGEFAIETVKRRVAKGIGADDTPMPPLTPADAKFKIRNGLKPIRDLRGTGKSGHMLDALQVTSATDSNVKMTFTTHTALQKASINSARAPFLGFSGSDQKEVTGFFEGMLTDVAEATRGEITRVWATKGKGL